MLGTKVLCEERPKGVFIEGFITGTPTPGTVMMLTAATEPIMGRYNWSVYDVSADGIPALIAVLLEKEHEGKIITDAYVTGDWGYLYCPVAGEKLNMLIQNPAGTADTYAIGDALMVDDGTGTLVKDSSGVSKCFNIIETKATYLTADTHLGCMYSGH